MKTSGSTLSRPQITPLCLPCAYVSCSRYAPQHASQHRAGQTA
ncbi:hypothetical protein HI814_14530 [Ralstonia solanacearum]|nr:hypothetical protein HI814_14530 [Ralstonia solanacearum]QKM33829.1 hypothetical protein HI794_14525 [Ralstonia solanacearum]QKM38816.1 hypothetical protein HI793_14535 [Ralstonia solanacearum]